MTCLLPAPLVCGGGHFYHVLCVSTQKQTEPNSAATHGNLFLRHIKRANHYQKQAIINTLKWNTTGIDQISRGGQYLNQKEKKTVIKPLHKQEDGVRVRVRVRVGVGFRVRG